MKKFSKILLLIATIFSYIASPISVLADEIISMPLIAQLEAITLEDGTVSSYDFTYISERNDYENEKNYNIELETTVTYTNNSEEVLSEEIITVSGETLNSMRSSYMLANPISEYYNGTYVLDVTVYDGETSIYNNQYSYGSNTSVLSGLTGKLNGVAATSEKVSSTTVGNYDVTLGEKYTQSLNVLTGELSPIGMYRVVYGEELYSEVMTGEVLRTTVFTGTETDLTGKLAGTYSYTDTITIEEVVESETEGYEVVNTYTYSYDANLECATDNDDLFNTLYSDKAVFEDGYMIVNAKELNGTESVITLGELVSALTDTGVTIEVLDEEGNVLDLISAEDEVKNGYVVNFTNGATASYVVVVKGDATSDNTFNNDDLVGVMEGYINEENMPSMDMITLEEEASGEEEPVLQEFGTITFEDVVITNELLKEDANVDKEVVANTDLTLDFNDLPSEIFVGDSLELQVLVNSTDATDYIDGFDGSVITSENLLLTDVVFNEEFTGIYNEEGRIVAVGGELTGCVTLMTLVFNVVEEGTGTIELTGNIAKFLNVNELETLNVEFEITRNVSTNNNLTSLNASIGTFDVEFDKDVTVYTLTVPHDTESVILSGALEDTLSQVDGLVEYELTENKTTAIITVTAEDGTTKVYTVYIVKEAAPVSKPIVYYYSSNNYLQSLEVDGYEIEFDKYTDEYRITVKNNVTSLDISALAEDYRSRVEITGNEGFEEGENTVTITVTAENGSTREYKLIVEKEEKKQTVPVTQESSNTAEKVVIIILIILVVLGLLYLIFKKDEEENTETPVKKEEPRNNNNKNEFNNKKNNNGNKSNNKNRKK